MQYIAHVCIIYYNMVLRITSFTRWIVVLVLHLHLLGWCRKYLLMHWKNISWHWCLELDVELCLMTWITGTPMMMVGTRIWRYRVIWQRGVCRYLVIQTFLWCFDRINPYKLWWLKLYVYVSVSVFLFVNQVDWEMRKSSGDPPPCPYPTVHS